MTDAAQQEAGALSAGERAFTAWSSTSGANPTPLMWTWSEMPESQRQRWEKIAEAARSAGEVTSPASGAVEAAFAQGYDDGYEDCAAGHDKDHSLSWAAHKDALAALSTSKGGGNDCGER